MSNPSLTLPEENRKNITKLEIATSVLGTKVDNLTTSLNRIETNHLVHLKDDIKDLSTDFKKFSGEMNTKLNSLQIADASQKPNQDLFTKIIEYVILAIVMAGISFLIASRV